MAKKAKKRFCVSAGAPGFPRRFQGCHTTLKAARAHCRDIGGKANRCKISRSGKSGGKRRCLKWSKPR